MIITTTEVIQGKAVTKTIGLVKGSTIRGRHVGRDFMASLRSVVGGEITEYTKMLAESREQAMQRMVADAEAQGANLGVAQAGASLGRIFGPALAGVLFTAGSLALPYVASAAILVVVAVFWQRARGKPVRGPSPEA